MNNQRIKPRNEISYPSVGAVSDKAGFAGATGSFGNYPSNKSIKNNSVSNNSQKSQYNTSRIDKESVKELLNKQPTSALDEKSIKDECDEKIDQIDKEIEMIRSQVQGH